MPLPLALGILSFAALMLLGVAAKREGSLTAATLCGVGAWICLAWGIVGWVWPHIFGR
jgi:hypothetical protein